MAILALKQLAPKIHLTPECHDGIVVIQTVVELSCLPASSQSDVLFTLPKRPLACGIGLCDWFLGFVVLADDVETHPLPSGELWA